MWLLRDGAFAALATTLAGMYVQTLRTAPRSPWQSAYVERVIGFMQRRRSPAPRPELRRPAGVRWIIFRQTARFMHALCPATRTQRRCDEPEEGCDRAKPDEAPLRCADNSLYVGETSNLQTRERDHNDGRGGTYTAKRRPVRIVHAERHSSKQAALKREQQLKRWNLQRKSRSYRATLRLYRVPASGPACEPHSRGGTGCPANRMRATPFRRSTLHRQRCAPRSSGTSLPPN